MKQQAGFTIIELIVVIALLGILGAVALPRFINVTEDAHRASVQGVAGALASAVSLVRAQAIVENTASGNTLAIDGTNIIVNAQRAPVNTNGAVITNGSGATAVTAAGCVNVWGAILQASAPNVAAAAAAGVDYVATAAGATCSYAYQPDTSTAGVRTITYNTANGTVATANL